MSDGDKAPTRPSYCHPLADGVTPWLTHSLAGIVPLSPGFGAGFVAMPHVSASTPKVSATTHSPQGPIRVDAVRGSVERVTAVTVTVESPRSAGGRGGSQPSSGHDGATGGLVGLRLKDEATGCDLDLRTVTLDGIASTVRMAATTIIDRVHPHVSADHAYVAVPSGRHTVRAEFTKSCMAALAPPLLVPSAPIKATLGVGLPDVPPFRPTSYSGNWSTDNTTRGGGWRGR